MKQAPKVATVCDYVDSLMFISPVQIQNLESVVDRGHKCVAPAFADSVNKERTIISGEEKDFSLICR